MGGKCGCLCKAFKIVFWGTVFFVVLAVVLAATVQYWISPVACSVSKAVVPQITGTGFAMEKCSVNPWNGTVRISGVRLDNPEGYGSSPAFAVRNLSLDVSLAALLDDTIHVKDLLIEDPFVSYFPHNGTNNFDLIAANAKNSLDRDDDEAPVSPKPGTAAKEAEDVTEEIDEETSEMRFIIDRARITGTKVKILKSDLLPPLPVMDLELKDIGKKSGGASFAEIVKALSDAVAKGMSSAKDGAGALGALLGDGAKSLSATATDVSGRTVEAAGSVADGAKAAAGEVGAAASSAIGEIGNATKKAANELKSFFKSFKE